MQTPVYEVALETGGLGFEKAGPLFERYAVNLNGQIDRRWVECYTKLTKERPNLSRFRLEPGASVVTFTCRATDGPAEVQGVLERLRDMIGLVNQGATAAAAAEAESAKRPAQSASPRPGAKLDETAVGRLAAMTSGLLARFSRATAAPTAAPNGRSK